MFKLTKFISVGVLLLFTTTAFAQQPVYQGNYRYVRQLITRIDGRTNSFRTSLDNSYNRGRINDSRAQQDLIRSTSDFQNAVYRLRTNFDRRQASTADVQDVLDSAARIDSLLGSYRVNAQAQTNWSNLRPDLNELARAFGLSWSSNEDNYPTYPTYPTGQGYGRILLTGTYRLNPSRSDDASTQANRAIQSLPYQDRQRVRDLVTARLESPDQIAIDQRGRTITLASSRGQQITFDADGTERVETTRSGRTIRASATLSGNQLVVSSTGDRANQFSVTFRPIDNGRALEVTRRVYVEGLSYPVEVRSVYDKTSDVASFDIYREDQTNPTYPTTGANGDFIVRDGEEIVGTLDDLLSTRNVNQGDRFTMTVRQPSRLEGAQIVGHVTSVERSGRLTGRAQMTLDFDTIRLRDGTSYRFAGVLQNVRMPSGDTVRVDNEGTVKDDSQTNKTAQRAAIGTAVGAIIGAIAGGGKGAAIGAIVGAGGGAGSVYVQGKDDLELDRGTEIVIRASAPRN
ncbi:MAG TPA: YMGG-like glycine zipper-containing protein [Pyrinomonadaceae bacterium]|nr:YMGG-like glycine zipper-containing protein [Pyrinomonadaceae bacterium]